MPFEGNGKCAEVIYKVPKKDKAIYTSSLLKENNFISDGGLKSKKTKFGNNHLNLKSKKNSINLTESVEKKTPLATMPNQPINFDNNKSKKKNKNNLKKDNNKILSNNIPKNNLSNNIIENNKKNNDDKRENDVNKRINSLKLSKKLKINNFFDNINEEDSKYYNPTQPNLKNSKSNYKESKNIYERRKNYKVPNKNNNESNENLKQNEEGNREQLIAELINNSEFLFIQDFQKKIQEETKGKDYKDIEQKIHILKDNNIDVQQLLQDEDDEENKNTNENN